MANKLSHYRKTLHITILALLIVVLFSLTGCGPSEEEITARVAEAAAETISARVPSTMYPTYTALPSLTPNATYTAQPTQTAYPTYTKPPTQTAYPTFTSEPTATRVIARRGTLTASPTLYPTHTPYPTYTKFPTHTSFPTLTAYPTYTVLPSLTPNATYTAQPTPEPQVVWQIVTATDDPDILKADKKDGFYLVGIDIAPGIWTIRTDARYTKCYWKLTDRRNQIIRNYLGTAGGSIIIDDTMLQLEIQNCGTIEFVQSQ